MDSPSKSPAKGEALMKDIFNFEYKLIHSAPTGSTVDAAFTDKVMNRIMPMSLKQVAIKSKTKHISLLQRLKHLPKFAAILLALFALFTVSGVTYAVIETIKHSNVKIEESGLNSSGRQQLTVTFDSCAEGKEAGTTYELKKDSGLSAEDGAKVLQARCDLDYIASWIKNDTFLSSMRDENNPPIPIEFSVGKVIGTMNNISETDLTLHTSSDFTHHERDQVVSLPKNTRVIEGGKVVDRSSLHSGDSLLYYTPSSLSEGALKPTDPEVVVVFKLGVESKYYSLDMRSYVKAKVACTNNPARTCVIPNSINTVFLTAAQGSAKNDPTNEKVGKVVQGKVLLWNADEIRLDVGSNVVYTIHTPQDVIGLYNNKTVYGLKEYDTIYAKTDPEALKIRVGDSLEINYQEEKDASSQTLEWSQTFTINLMVERTVKDIEVLQKY